MLKEFFYLLSLVNVLITFIIY